MFTFEFLNTFFWGFQIKYAFLTLACVLCYGSHLNGDFVFDDTVAIVKNWDVTRTMSIKEIFQHDFWGFNLTDSSSHKSYRPLTILTFRLEHSLYGLNAFRMKLVNLILHIFATWLIVPFWESIFCSPEDQIVAIGAALLFAIHPIHTEAVAGIVGRAELLVAGVFLSSLILYNTQIGKSFKGFSISKTLMIAPLFSSKDFLIQKSAILSGIFYLRNAESFAQRKRHHNFSKKITF